MFRSNVLDTQSILETRLNRFQPAMSWFICLEGQYDKVTGLKTLGIYSGSSKVSGRAIFIRLR